MITEEQVKEAVNYLGGEFISYEYDSENFYYKIVCKTKLKLSAKDIESYSEQENNKTKAE